MSGRSANPFTAENEGSPTSALTTDTLLPSSNTQPARGSPIQNVMTLSDDDSAAGEDVLTPNNDDSTKDESYLARELADLRTLQAQLAALAKEVHARERWLAEAVGATPPSSITDCNGVVCVIQTILRKTKYAAQGTLNTDHDDTTATPSLPANRTILSLIHI